MAITIDGTDPLGAVCLGVVRTKNGVLETAGSATITGATLEGSLGTGKTVGGLNGMDMPGTTADYIDLPGISGTTDIFTDTDGTFSVVVIGSFDGYAASDVRVVSKDKGTASADHDWMVGEAGNDLRSRIHLNYTPADTHTILAGVTIDTATKILMAGGSFDDSGNFRHRTAYYNGTTFSAANDGSTNTGYVAQATTTAKIGRTAASAANPWDGMHYATYWFSTFPSQTDLEGLYTDPDQFIIEGAAGGSAPIYANHINRLNQG